MCKTDLLTSRVMKILTLKFFQRHLPSLLRQLPMWFPFMSCLTSQIQLSAERHARFIWSLTRRFVSVGDWFERLETQPSSWRTPSKRLYLVELRQLRGASDVSSWTAQSGQRQCRGPETARHSTGLCGQPSTPAAFHTQYCSNSHGQTMAQGPYVTR